MIDLSHPLDGAWTYPGDPPVTVEEHATHADDGYRVARVSMGTHAGTHVDAPAHTEPDGETLGAVPVERFCWAARRVDCRGVGGREAIRPAHLPDAGTTADADCLVLWTDWDRHWGTDRYRDHPYLAPATARECARRGLDVAVDAPSVDPTPPAGPETGGEDGDGLAAHHALLGEGHLVVENLRGLGRPPGTFALRAYPLAVDADAAPVRAVAVAGDD